MGQQTLVRWLKFLLLFAAVCGAALCVGALPLEGKRLAAAYPEFARAYVPWLVFAWMLALPCFAALLLAWKVFGNIERDCSFCMENAGCLRKISFLAGMDAALLPLGNVVFLLLDMNHPAVLLLSLVVAVAGSGISVAAAVLSHLVQKAALLQEESEWTI